MAASMPGFGNIADELRRVTVQVLADGSGAGSGVIIGRATVITNAHVANTDLLRVRLSSGELFPATAVRRDGTHDLALLRAPDMPDSAPLAMLRETTSLLPGEIAIAVGHPLGFIGAVSTGIFRGVGPIPGLTQRPWVQATVRLAPGNSGGPLADSHGRITGINAMVMNGLSLAAPAEAVQRLLSLAAAFRLGVTVRPVRLHDGGHSLSIVHVQANSPAATASLLPGDLITAVDTIPIYDVETLEDALISAGSQKRGYVTVRFRRHGSARERQTTAATKASGPAEQLA